MALLLTIAETAGPDATTMPDWVSLASLTAVALARALAGDTPVGKAISEGPSAVARMVGTVTGAKLRERAAEATDPDAPYRPPGDPEPVQVDPFELDKERPGG